jgi:hypothetical protein
MHGIDHAGSMKWRRDAADRLAASAPRSLSPTTALFGSWAMWPSVMPRARCCDTAGPGAFVAAAVPATSRSGTAPTLSRDAAVSLQAARPYIGTPAVSLTTDDCEPLLSGASLPRRRVLVRAPDDGRRGRRRRVLGLRLLVQPAPGWPRRKRRLRPTGAPRGGRHVRPEPA